MTSFEAITHTSRRTTKQETINLVGRAMKIQRQHDNITWQGTLGLMRYRGFLSGYINLAVAS